MKRLLAVLLTVVLLFTSVPMVVLAEMPSDFQTRFNIDKLEGKWKDGDGVEYDTVTLEYQVKGTGLASWQGAWLAIDMTKLIWVHNTKDGNSILSRIGEGKTFVPGNKEIVQFASTNFHSFREIFDEDDEPLDQWAFDAGVATGGRVSADQKTLYINPQPRQVAVDASQKPIKVDYEDFTTILSYRLAIVPGAELSTDSIRYATLEESSQSYVILMNDGTNHYTYVGEGEENDFLPIPFTGTAGITGQAPAAKVDAVKPVISADPAGASYFVGAEATPLTVTATVTDGGTLSYEWFKNTTASNEGGVSVGTGATYTPATDALGDTYYYVVVTNTNEAATGAKTATATSAVAKVSVSVDPDVEAIEAAAAALNGATWTEIAQETANTKETVQAKLLEQAQAVVNNSKVNVTVEVTDFTAAVEGTAATTKEGTNGKAIFTVKAAIGNEEYTLSAQEVVIKAKAFDGRLDSEVIADAETALNAVVWTDIAQVTANTKDDVQAKLLEQAQAAVNNSRVSVTVEITTFEAAVAGSAATTHEGTNGKAIFTVKAACGAEEYTLTGKEIAITATSYDDKLDSEVIAEVETALNGATWTEIAQVTANTKDDVQAKLLEQAQAVVNNSKVNVTVEVTDFIAAVEGTAATTKEGTNGKAIFTVKAAIGNEEFTLSGKEIAITATPFDGKLDSEVIEDVKTALTNAVWAEIAQETANTKEAAQAQLKTQADRIINNTRVTVTVEATAFEAAVAGSAATTHEGTNGKVTFTVYATVGAEEYELGNLSAVVKATRFNGVLDKDAVEAAQDTLTDCLVIVEIGADADEIREAIEKYLDSKMTGDADGVTVTIESVTDNQYKLVLTKGGETVEKTIEITVEEEDPIKLSAPANLVFANGVASWDAVANAVSYTVSLYEVVDGTYTLLTTANAAQNQCDFNALIEDGKYYAFDVCALGDGVYFLDSDVSDFSEVYRKGNTIEQILAVLMALRNSKYAITAEAGEGGVISGEGVTKVKYGNDITYYITAMPGYEIDRVIVDGKDVGAVSEYTFENVKKKHTITVTFKEVVWENPFTDVSAADPYYDAVRFVYDCKLFNGISETEFAPQMSMTRAMFVTVLWRLEGMPVVNYLMQYDDVADETWYTEAIRWATAEGIVEGYGDGIFGTDDAVTVQQATVIMARYAQYAGTYTAPTANMDIFADNADVADWAVEAMAWAVENGIYAPANGKLNPTAMAPRSLAAQFMHAYVVKFSK